jgi:hypothetical protein
MVVRVRELTFPPPLLLPLLLLLCEGFFKEVENVCFAASLDSFLFFSSSSRPRPRPPFLNFQQKHGASQHAPRI